MAESALHLQRSDRNSGLKDGDSSTRNSTIPATSETVNNLLTSDQICESTNMDQTNKKAADDSGNDDIRQVILEIVVEIEEGHTENMTVREGDIPERVVRSFCDQHSLSDQFVVPLLEHIINNLKDISNDQSNASGQPSTATITEAQSQDSPHADNREFEEIPRPDTPRKSNENSAKPSLEFPAMKADTSQTAKFHPMRPSFSSLLKEYRKATPAEKTKGSNRSPQLLRKTKAVYMRLYVEFLRHQQRLEEDKRMCLEEYEERIAKNKPTFSKKTRKIMVMRGRAAKQFKNYGELLYREGLNKDEERKKLIEKKQLEDQESELKGVTAKPEISKFARQLRRNGGQVWERLANDKTKSHLTELRHESMETKLMECTFKPQINRSNHGDDESYEETMNRFEQLFWDAENRRRRQAEYMQWYPEGVTFRPLINRQCTSGNSDYKIPEGSVFDRLLHYAGKMAEKRQKGQKNQSKLTDPTTGQLLFRPQTGRKPQNQRNLEALPIGEFLYQLKFAIDNKKQTVVERDLQKKKELANRHYVSHKSLKLLGNLQERHLREVFNHLDTKKDGYVELDTANTKNLPDEIIEDIEDLKRSTPDSRKHLDFEQFVILMIDIQKKKNRGLHFVLRCYKKHLEPEKFPFRFKMDRYSQRLASGRRKFGNSRQWYKLILSDREKRQSRIEAMRKEKENQELAECTFRPSVRGTNFRNPTRLIRGNSERKHCSSPPTVVEKEHQEMHGFIFKEANVQEGDSLTRTDAVSPLHLLESLKRIVSKSSETHQHIQIPNQNQNEER